jgi:hypothetical protein
LLFEIYMGYSRREDLIYLLPFCHGQLGGLKREGQDGGVCGEREREIPR